MTDESMIDKIVEGRTETDIYVRGVVLEVNGCFYVVLDDLQKKEFLVKKDKVKRL